MISRATGDNIRVSLLMKPAVIINRIEFTITKMPADRLLIIPEGISLAAVLGFIASYLLSASLLNPMAAFLAKIMHKITRIRSLRLKEYSSFEIARKKPIRAKGMANTVWLKRTRDK